LHFIEQEEKGMKKKYYLYILVLMCGCIARTMPGPSPADKTTASKEPQERISAEGKYRNRIYVSGGDVDQETEVIVAGLEEAVKPEAEIKVSNLDLKQTVSAFSTSKGTFVARLNARAGDKIEINEEIILSVPEVIRLSSGEAVEESIEEIEYEAGILVIEGKTFQGLDVIVANLENGWANSAQVDIEGHFKVSLSGTLNDPVYLFSVKAKEHSFAPPSNIGAREEGEGLYNGKDPEHESSEVFSGSSAHKSPSFASKAKKIQ
jgi:hypothetical protein